MSANGAVRAVRTVVILAVIGLLAAGALAPEWPVFAALAGVVVVTGVIQGRLRTAAREARDARLVELAAAHGLQPVDPPRPRGLVTSLRGAAQGDASVNDVDPERESPTWSLWHAVLPSGTISCRFLAIGQRHARPLRLSVERTTSSSGSGSRRRSKSRRSVAVATRVGVEGTAEVRPSGRTWQAIGGAVGRALGQESHQVGVPAFDDAYAVTGDAETAQRLVDPSTAAWWPERLGEARVAIADGWLAGAREVPLDAEETATASEQLLSAVTELADRLDREDGSAPPW